MVSTKWNPIKYETHWQKDPLFSDYSKMLNLYTYFCNYFILL